MEQLPIFTGIFFGLTTLMTVLLFYRAARYSKTVLRISTGWLLLQGIIALTGFYTVTDSIPPRFLLLAGPPLLFILLLFCTPQGRAFVDRLDLQTLTMLHIIRIPVELVLFWLFFFGVVPEVMTYEGRNFDILSGLTAPLVFYFVFIKNKIGRKAFLIWNFICLGLLFNIVIHAVLSAPSPFQKMAFDQPNVAVLHFPFIWLPCCVVPLVLLSHLAAIRQLIKK
ncbi:MAG: hypothetical protein K0R51_952 [Cytophagaceae bacterium]|jgi:hypothetical protein|nr:hypothetical protein [Cytophagaceae bacterium]